MSAGHRHDHHGHDGHDHDGHDHDGHDHDHDHAGAEPARGFFGHSHAHSHPHHDRSAPRGERARRALKGALILNGIFLVVEALAGWWSGSLALLSDAAHMVSDVAALALALWTAHLVLRPATPARTFGLLRAEVLGAFVNAVALIAASFFIFKEAIERLVHGAPSVPGVPIIVVGAVGLAINLGSAWFLVKSDPENLNVRGALLHMLADAAGSLGALLAGVFTVAFGWVAADAVMGLIIGTLVLWGTWSTIRDTAEVLLEFAPRGLDQDVITRALREIDGIADVHELHVWTLGGGQPTVTAHIVARSGAAPYEVLKGAEDLLRARFGVQHTTLQIDPDATCAQVNCPVLSPDLPP